jgi:arginine N-succinyltransferase
MEVVRAVRVEELEQLYELIRRATYGMTSLQITREQLLERIELSQFAFSRRTDKSAGEPYVLTMEDQKAGQLVGISCVFTKVGGYEPFYSYRVLHSSHESRLLDVRQERQTLHLCKIHDGPTEIGSLFLLPEYRGQGRGRLLSLCRFALMAMRPNRFAEEVIAEMRGRVDDQGNSPFWEAIGRNFFGVEYPQADSLSTVSKTFIEDLMPQHPIYLCLLPEAARAVIGQVHDQTLPALAMLEAEGFRRRDMIDIFDGGPRIHCVRKNIDAVRRTKRSVVSQITDHVEGEPQIVSSASEGFRCMLTPAVIQSDETCQLSNLAALTLRVRQGDAVWVMHPKPPKPSADSDRSPRD